MTYSDTHTFTIEDCASLTIDDDPERTHPHAGESVTLRRPRSIAQRRLIADIIALSERGSGAFRRHQGLDELLATVEAFVVSWTWTDAEGHLLPLPARPHPGARREDESAEHYALRVQAGRDQQAEARAGLEANVDVAELLWIASAVIAGGDPEAAQAAGKDSGGSSPPSA